MASENNLIEAKKMLDLICRTLDEHEWKYQCNEDDLAITCGARGDDLPMDILILVRPDTLVLSYFSILPFKVNKDKRVEASLAINAANYGTVCGSFDYNLSDGEIRYRLSQGFRGSDLSSELIYDLLMRVAVTVDRYNDKFLAISSGIMTLEDFIKFENQKG